MQLIETINGRRVHTLAGHMEAALFHALALEHDPHAECERLESVCLRCVWAEDLDAALARYHGCVAARLDLSPSDFSLGLIAED